jgi:hypothetical protein
VAATATTLRVNEAWAVKPDATSKYQVGGIAYRYTGGRLRYAPGEKESGRSVEVQYEPTAERQVVNLRVYQDFSVTPRKLGRRIDAGQRAGVTAAKGGLEYVIDLSKPEGHLLTRMDGHREGMTDAPRVARVELEGVSGPEQVVIGEMVMTGLVR